MAMQILRGSDNIANPLVRAVLTMGNFDGVHRGHQAILARVVDVARSIGGTPVVYTFDPHPATVLAPERPFFLLQTIPQRLRVLADCGIAVTVLEPFTASLAALAPKDFFDNILRARIAPTHVIVGYDFTFGLHRAGRVELLKTLGSRHLISVEVIEPVFDKETLISSTYIRQCLREGRIASATAALGRPHAIEGALVRGRGIGRQIGFPTANLLPDNALIPPDGVYITSVRLDNRTYPAATYIGRNPTFGGETQVIETYLLDFAGTIEAERMEIALHELLRGDVRFDSTDALRTQIEKDVAAARKYHTNRT
ncbi:MAG: bifunctional riboflavin kinase/FAD synthetase [Deltaproteobacteria bacterium]|nr:bifunctional riboflavin kinase/FAD synthetase [Deltaproteobacteria bacterium]